MHVRDYEEKIADVDKEIEENLDDLDYWRLRSSTMGDWDKHDECALINKRLIKKRKRLFSKYYKELVGKTKYLIDLYMKVYYGTVEPDLRTIIIKRKGEENTYYLAFDLIETKKGVKNKCKKMSGQNGIEHPTIITLEHLDPNTAMFSNIIMMTFVHYRYAKGYKDFLSPGCLIDFIESMDKYGDLLKDKALFAELLLTRQIKFF